MDHRMTELRQGLETAFINKFNSSSVAYRPQFVSNNYKEGKKVLSTIENELLNCDQFSISVAFITMSGITPLLQTLKELEKKGIPGQILTTDYLCFSEPKALEKLESLANLTVKMYLTETGNEGFHTKGYIFQKNEMYRIIIGSSNMTMSALTTNREWNTKIISAPDGEMAGDVLREFHQLWNSENALKYDDFIERYALKYEILKKQREIAKQEAVPSIEQYRLKPNSMQLGFVENLMRIREAGGERALLISATGARDILRTGRKAA